MSQIPWKFRETPPTRGDSAYRAHFAQGLSLSVETASNRRLQDPYDILLVVKASDPGPTLEDARDRAAMVLLPLVEQVLEKLRASLPVNLSAAVDSIAAIERNARSLG